MRIGGAARTLIVAILGLGLVVGACNDPVEQQSAQTSRTQPQQAQSQEDAIADQRQSDAPQSEQESTEQSHQDAQQQSDGEAASDATQSMQVEQDEEQSAPAVDPYGGGGGESVGEPSDDQSEAPVPPVREWLVEGTALVPSHSGVRDEYGWTTVIEGDVIAAGAPYHDAMGVDTGAVFIF